MTIAERPGSWSMASGFPGNGSAPGNTTRRPALDKALNASEAELLSGFDVKLPFVITTSSILIAAVFFAGGFMANNVVSVIRGPIIITVTQTQTVRTTIVVQGSSDGWRELFRFTGTSEPESRTVPFTISSGAWRIRCSHAGSSSLSHIAFGVYPGGQPANVQTILLEGATSKGTTGTSVVYLKGPGDFYLVVLTLFVVMWTVVIEVPG